MINKNTHTQLQSHTIGEKSTYIHQAPKKSRLMNNWTRPSRVIAILVIAAWISAIWIGPTSMVGVRAQTPVIVKPLVLVSQAVDLSVYEMTLTYLRSRPDVGPEMESGDPVSVSMVSLYHSMTESVYFGSLHILDPSSWRPNKGYQFFVRRTYLTPGNPASGVQTYYYREVDSSIVQNLAPRQPTFTGLVELEFFVDGLHLAYKSVPSPVLDYFRDSYRISGMWCISNQAVGVDRQLTMGFVCEEQNPIQWAPPELVLLKADYIGGRFVHIRFEHP